MQEKLTKELESFQRIFVEFEDVETEHKWTEEVLQERILVLDKRVKELNCLYSIASLAEKPNHSFEQVFSGVVDLVPLFWQYPEITCARIILDGQEFRTNNFKETIWKQTSDIVVHGDRIGALEVCYLEEKPEIDEGPFLKEERLLINAITKRLGRITERMRAEEESRKYHVHLEEMIKGRTAKLKTINKQLQREITELRKAQEQLQHSQLLATLGEMTAGIAHEVNNPLGIVLLYSELLMARDVPSKAKKDLKVVHDEAKRAAKIMTDLLAYCRKLNPEMRCVNLHKILKKVLNMRRYRLKVQNIKLSTNFLRGPLYIKGDSSQLMQVFMNLILNAEEVLKNRKSGNIVTTTWVDGEWAKVSIADDGTGITEEKLSQVFYPFFTTKSAGEGTGLGLSICYGIVTNHNGLIHAKNNEMGGATFTVEIPLAQVKR